MEFISFFLFWLCLFLLFSKDRSSYKRGYADAKKKYLKKCPIQTKVICSAGTCETTVDHCSECNQSSEPKIEC